MSLEENSNTFTKYLGPEFQMNLMWQLLVESEFCEKTMPVLSVDYFDDPLMKRLFIIMNSFYNEHEKVPNIRAETARMAVSKYRMPNNIIEEESLFAIIDKIEQKQKDIDDGKILHSGEAIQKETNYFIKQQEYRKLGEFILGKTKTGDIRNKDIVVDIETKIDKILHIGDNEDYGTDVFHNIKNALRKEFRNTIPTGITVIDNLTGGGLGKGEIGLILAPGGVGKTTELTIIANSAFAEGKKVLQIIFEDTVEQIQRKHCTIWSKVKLSELEDNNELVEEIVNKKAKETTNGGKLIIKRFSQDGTTMVDIKKWIQRYQKQVGYKFDIVILDYLDCLDSHKKTADRNEAELVIVKSFVALAADFDIPCWSALQGNRTSYTAEFLNVNEMGGSIKRYQKAHFFMSIAKPEKMKDSNLANVRILKARFAKDGQSFENSIIDNDNMQIILDDSKYNSIYSIQSLSEEKKAIDDKKFNDIRNKETDDLRDAFIQVSETTPNDTLSDLAVKVGNQYIPVNEIASETIGDQKQKIGRLQDIEPEIRVEPDIELIEKKNYIDNNLTNDYDAPVTTNTTTEFLDKIENSDLLHFEYNESDNTESNGIIISKDGIVNVDTLDEPVE